MLFLCAPSLFIVLNTLALRKCHNSQRNTHVTLVCKGVRHVHNTVTSQWARAKQQRTSKLEVKFCTQIACTLGIIVAMTKCHNPPRADGPGWHKRGVDMKIFLKPVFER